ncbi:unnamed protein product, partial [Symbiodinium pilosum]
MLSGRFTSEDKIKYFHAVKGKLKSRGIRTYMVETAHDYGVPTASYLFRARIMVAFCTSTYGEVTTRTYETWSELKHVYEHPREIELLPVKLITHWPPQPPGHEDGKSYCKLAFGPSRLFVEGLDREGKYLAPDVLAHRIVEHITRLGLLDEVQQQDVAGQEEFSLSSMFSGVSGFFQGLFDVPAAAPEVQQPASAPPTLPPRLPNRTAGPTEVQIFSKTSG